MDHYALMWDDATRDLDAENREAALTHALADLNGVRDFTHAARTRTEYGHRMALAIERIAHAASVWDVPIADLGAALDTSYAHVLAARQAAAADTARKTAAATTVTVDPAAQANKALTITAAIGSQDTTDAPTAPPGAPADPLAVDTTAKTSKPRTLPSGGSAAPVPMPAPVTPGVAPAPAAMSPAPAAAPGAQATPPRTASRQSAIEADIAALNPHLPPATITRLAKNAMRHLAAEPLAYGNWDNPSDGPITNSIKNWTPPGHGGGDHADDGAGLSPGGDDSPAGPAAAGTAADAAGPATSTLADALPLAAAAAAR